MRKLLFPFAVLYNGITFFRNFLYNKGVLHEYTFETPIICIGNLSTGGTGKSPLLMYLAKKMQKKYKLASLSRGYGRKTNGFRYVTEESTYKDVGDEPFMIYQRFKDSIAVTVGEDRPKAVKRIISEVKPELIILDDAYQHRAIKAGFNILLTDFSLPYFDDNLLPMGNLRESKEGAKRADIILVTKCPLDLDEETKQRYIRNIAPIKHQHVFFSHVIYSDNLILNGKKKPIQIFNDKNVLLITGIAKGKDLESEVKKHAKSCCHISYSDHYNFKKKDALQIQKTFNELPEDKIILTTEKDFVRLSIFSKLLPEIYFWPISVCIDNERKFNNKIKKYLSTVK